MGVMWSKVFYFQDSQRAFLAAIHILMKRIYWILRHGLLIVKSLFSWQAVRLLFIIIVDFHPIHRTLRCHALRAQIMLGKGPKADV